MTKDKYGLTLAEHIAAILADPDVPSEIYNALSEAVCDLQSGPTDTPSWVEFSLARAKEAEETGH